MALSGTFNSIGKTLMILEKPQCPFSMFCIIQGFGIFIFSHAKATTFYKGVFKI